MALIVYEWTCVIYIVYLDLPHPGSDDTQRIHLFDNDHLNC